MGSGREEGGGGEVGGEGTAGEGGHPGQNGQRGETFYTDVGVMQVLRKLQTSCGLNEH